MTTSKPVFLETIKVLDGQFCNIELHLDRIEKTLFHFFNQSSKDSIRDILFSKDVPQGLIKCRISYSINFFDIEFEKYTYKEINSLKIIEDDLIEYHYKYKDRYYLDQLLSRKGTCDDILIAKDGYITDTSFSNVVFENSSGLYTPTTYLLNGTKRRLLLKDRIIERKEIKLSSLFEYNKLYLINAMINLEDNISVDIHNLLFESTLN